MRPHVSFSEWQLFKNQCQWRWKLDYLDGHRKSVYGVHLDFGTSIHAAIEKYKTRKDPISLEESIKIFMDEFQKLWDENSSKYEERDRKNDPAEFLLAGERVLKGLHKCDELWNSEVVYNEYPLFIDIDRTDDVKVKFKGFIDLVIKTKDGRGKTILYVCDFKSCSWGWDREKRQDRDLHAQLFLYKHFLCKKFNLNPKDVRTAFILLKKRPRKGDDPVEFFPVSAGPVSVQRALDSFSSSLTEMSEGIKNDSFRKNRDACVNKFGQTCPYLDSDLCQKN